MNNHWGTNYRAYQEGPTVFRFILRPHGASSPAEATRFATAFSQPLIAVPSRGRAPTSTPRWRVEPPEVVVTAFKPSEDGRALIVRLFGASGKTLQARLAWATPGPVDVRLSDTSEQAGPPVNGPIEVPALGLVTLRAELPR